MLNMNTSKQVKFQLTDLLSNESLIHHQKIIKGTKVSYHLKNLLIDRVLNSWLATYPSNIYSQRWCHDVIVGRTRAEHYGKAIGDVLKSFKRKHVYAQRFDDICAAKMVEIRKSCVDLGVIATIKNSIK
jgi:hypothetical protein